MTPATARLLRNITLGLVLLLILVNVLGMLEVIPKLAPPPTLNILAFALILVAFGLRRRGAGPRP
jgi:heme A synthase